MTHERELRKAPDVPATPGTGCANSWAGQATCSSAERRYPALEKLVGGPVRWVDGVWVWDLHEWGLA